MEPWQSWALFLVIGGSCYYYYAQNAAPKKRTARAHSVTEEKPQLVEKEAPRGRKTKKAETGGAPSDTGSANENKRGRKKNRQAEAATAPAPAVGAFQAADDEDVDDKEWAKQLVANKKGMTLAPPARNQSHGKTVKQSAATSDFSAASSTGADADDDLSPAVSPSLGAGKGPSGKDVSDMLDAPGAGPSVLRLTESTKPTPAKQSKKQAAEVTKETKKQRQNRKKAEEAKLQREQDEKERQVLLEKQRRAAREARGEPAKNGLQSAAAPSANAWASKPEATAAVNETGLLDTFEPSNQTTGNTTVVAQNIPDEEEQMKMIMEDEGWNTVPKGRKNKKVTSSAAAENSADEAASATEAFVETKKQAAPSAAKATPSNNITPLVSIGNLQPASHKLDSDWAVV